MDYRIEWFFYFLLKNKKTTLLAKTDRNNEIAALLSGETKARKDGGVFFVYPVKSGRFYASVGFNGIVFWGGLGYCWF